MTETLTECLIKVSEDLAKLKKGRDCLEANPIEESRFLMRFIEPRNKSLEVCLSQSTPDFKDLMKSLLKFHFLVNNNQDPNVWTVFGYELGVICSKFLASIEKMEAFEVMLLKLLTIIKEISEYSLDAWKATARQILNVFINKKFSSESFETILKKYIVILRKIDVFELNNFSTQNINLVKTLLTLVQRVGDCEIQFAIINIVWLHLSKHQTLMIDVFMVPKEVSQLNEPLTFNDFEQDCRLYLNALNKFPGGSNRKVYSVSCQILYIGSYCVRPLKGQEVIWVDANKETERLSIKCTFFDSEEQNVIYLSFSEIIRVQIDGEKAEGKSSVTIHTKNLRFLHPDVENDIHMVVKGEKDVVDFVNFLETAIRKKVGKFSKTKPLLMDRSLMNKEGLQMNSTLTSARQEIDTTSYLSNAFGKPDEETIISQTQVKTPPPSSHERKIVLETQNSSSSSAEMHRIFEDTSQRQKLSHKLLNSQENIFLLEKEPEKEPFRFEFGKENQPPSKQKTYTRKPNPPKEHASKKRALRESKQPEAASEDIFRQNVQQKKPSLPKFKRKRKEPEVEKKKRQPRKNTRYKPLPIPEVTKHPESSLLDPNGYAFQRWKQPTTSERSNFWLKKLDERNKPKTDVFEFSNSESELTTKSKRKIVNSKRRYRKQKYDTKRPSLKEVTVILKNVKKTSLEKKKRSRVASPRPEEPYDVPASSVQPEPSLKRNEPPHPVRNKLNENPELSSEEEFLMAQKRDRSQEENSLTRVHLKKKSKTKANLPRQPIFSTVRQRSHKTDDKTRQQMNEIIATMNKALYQFSSHIQQKEDMRIKFYQKMVEETSTRLQAEAQSLNERSVRLQKAIIFFKAGCSVSNLQQSVRNQFDKFNNALKEVENKTDTEKKINRLTDRLKSLIELEVNKSIKNELDSKKTQMLRLSSILNKEPILS